MKIDYKGEQVEAYDLIMKKENALAILNGTKTVEIRPFTPSYSEKFTDFDQLEKNEKLREEGHEDQCQPPYRTDIGFIHFRNYNNSWSLDVAIDELGMTEMTEEGVRFLSEEFGFHDYDEEWQQYEGMPEEDIPLFYYMHIVEIVRQTGLQ